MKTHNYAILLSLMMNFMLIGNSYAIDLKELAPLKKCFFFCPTQKAHWIRDGHNSSTGIAFDHIRSRVVIGGKSGQLSVWQMKDGQPLRYREVGNGPVLEVFFISSRDIFITVSARRSVQYWDSDFNLIKEIKTEYDISAAKRSGDILVLGHRNGTTSVWNHQLGKKLFNGPDHNSSVYGLAISKDGQKFASSSYNNHIKLWSKDKVFPLETPVSYARTLVFDLNNNRLVGGAWFNMYHWDLTSGKLKVLDTDHKGIIKSMQMTNNPNVIASISRQTDSKVLFLDINTGKTLFRFQKTSLCGNKILLNQENNIMAATSDDGKVYFWDLDEINNK